MMFKNARLKLTLWYLLIIMLVSGFFSLIVYRGFTKEIGRGFRFQSMRTLERKIFIQRQRGLTRILPFWIYPEEVPPQEFNEIISLAKKRFAFQLLIINGGILILAGTAGYFLAGKTLHPIEVMVEEQKRFVADASHELRTPLTSMKSEIEVALRDKKLKISDFKRLLKSNLEEIDKMKYFSDSLLTLSCYESNGVNIDMQEFDLAEVVRQAISKNLANASKRGIKIKSKISEVRVKGNFESLVELVSILLDNAIKYSPEGKKIFIQMNKKGKNAEIKIKDKGIGISKKDLPHIFDRFYRVDSSRCKTKTEGYGLGLSIAKSIVDLHKGKIEVKSAIGKGTTFRISLPVHT